MTVPVQRERVGRGPTAARRNYKTSLCLQWVKVHRPDVFEAIEVEVEAKFPKHNRAYNKVVLPETLMRME